MRNTQATSVSSKETCFLLICVALLAALLGCSVGLPVTNAEFLDALSIRIQPRVGARGISANDYTVTSLEIEVTQVSSGAVVGSFTWVPGDGDTTYGVSVPDAGDYEIAVTHMGENNGDTVEAIESVTVSIVPMIITVVNVVPGQIGVIEVVGDVTPTYAGTWVNPDYDGSVAGVPPGKVVATDNGDGTFTCQSFDLATDTVPTDTFTVTLTDEWTDSEGNVFLKMEGWITGPVYIYELVMIHSDGDTAEATLSDVDYPTGIDPTGWYGIYYRQ